MARDRKACCLFAVACLSVSRRYSFCAYRKQEQEARPSQMTPEAEDGATGSESRSHLNMRRDRAAIHTLIIHGPGIALPRAFSSVCGRELRRIVTGSATFPHSRQFSLVGGSSPPPRRPEEGLRRQQICRVVRHSRPLLLHPEHVSLSIMLSSRTQEGFDAHRGPPIRVLLNGACRTTQG